MYDNIAPLFLSLIINNWSPDFIFCFIQWPALRIAVILLFVWRRVCKSSTCLFFIIRNGIRLAICSVTKYGFSSKLGLINYDNDSDEVFIGRDFGHTRVYGENIASEIDNEVRDIINDCYAKAKRIISDYRGVLDRTAQLLLEKEKIDREELEALFEGVEIKSYV